jgi:hypothetical protein
MKNKIIAVAVVALVVGAASGFYGGTKYQQGRSPTGQFGVGQRFGQSANGSRRNLSNFVVGEVLSKDSQSLTIKLRDGGSRIVLLSASTAVEKMASGSLDDLAVGKSVSVQGTSNSDGSVTATSVQLQRMMPVPSPSSNPAR